MIEPSFASQLPVLWRVFSPLGTSLVSEYRSEFLGCPIERLFYFVLRRVCAREFRLLRLRLKNWYSEDLSAKPGSHKPLERKLSRYPDLIKAEERAFSEGLGPVQRLWFRFLCVTSFAASGFLDEMRYRYRFFGIGDDVWSGGENLGKGLDLD